MTTTNPYTYEARRARAAAIIEHLVICADPSCEDEPCEMFALCNRTAIGYADVPTLGVVPTCARCAVALAQPLYYRCTVCRYLMLPGDAVTTYVCGEPADGVECISCVETHHVRNCDPCAAEISRGGDL